MTTKDQSVVGNRDHLGSAIENWSLQQLAADPATTYPRIYYNTVTFKIRYYDTDAAAWADLGAGSGSVVSVVPGHGVDVDNTDPANPVVAVDETELTVPEANVSGLTAALAAKQPLDPDLTALAAAGNSAVLAATTASFLTADETKLDGIEALADVTDAANVDAAGAVMNADTSTAAMAFVVDEDNMSSDSATKVPTQQSVKAYVDALGQGIRWKQSVRAATTAAITLATGLENGDTIDGVVLATGDRVLVKDQASGAENGIYVVAASGAPTRATDADTSAEMQGGTAAFVGEGTTNADSGWVMTNNGTVVLGTTALVFARFTGLSDVVAGTGLTKTANTLNANAGATPGSGGPGGGLVANADDLVVDTAVVARKYAVDIGDGSTEDIVVTHNLNTRDVVVAVRDAGSPYAALDCYWEATSVNTVTVFFPTGQPPASAAYRCIVHG